MQRSPPGFQRFRQGFDQPAACESCRHRKCLFGLGIGLRITSRLKRAYSRTERCVYRQIKCHGTVMLVLAPGSRRSFFVALGLTQLDSFLRASVWSLAWPFYWINYATDFLLLRPYG